MTRSAFSFVFVEVDLSDEPFIMFGETGDIEKVKDWKEGRLISPDQCRLTDLEVIYHQARDTLEGPA